MKTLLLSIVAAIALPVVASADDIADMKKIVKWVKPQFGDFCDFPEFASGQDIAENNKVYRIDYRYGYESDQDAAHRYTLYELHCGNGAYNVSNVYVGIGEDGARTLISFAEPELDIVYEDPDTSMKLKAPPKVTGFLTSNSLVNSSFDPATRRITSFSKWRGLGDAWSSGQWEFKDGQFVLREYTIDPVYELNGETGDNPDPEMDRPQDVFKLFPLP
jgi:hypothetical protein